MPIFVVCYNFITMKLKLSTRLSFTRSKIAAAAIALLLFQAAADTTAQELKPVEPANMEQESTEPRRSVQQMPDFPGGRKALMKYLHDNIIYPKDATKDGQVVAEFVVGRDGSLSDIKIIYSLDEACDAEVLRVVMAMPKWQPAKQDGNPVAAYFMLPVKFQKAIVDGYSQHVDSTATPFRSVENMPGFKGGMHKMRNFLFKNVKIPKGAPKLNGNVLVEFVVKKDGTLADFKIKNHLNPEYEAEVLRVMSIMPNWEPGRHHGEVVEVYFMLPFPFSNGKYR